MRNRLALLVLAGAATTGVPAAAQNQTGARPAAASEAAPDAPPDPPKKKRDPEKEPSMVLYAAALPFVEYLRPSGPTRAGFAEAPGHIGIGPVDYDGALGPPRGRMTPGSSHLGVRGSLPLLAQLRIVAQLETGMAVEGNPNPWEPTVPNRNSYAGFAGGWGTLVFGLLDTPYKWMTLTTVNPLKAGYVADYTPLLGTPGFRASGLNKVTNWVSGSGDSNAAFYRREANSIQYWSPSVYGFYGRFNYTTNEVRPEDSAISVRSNPYLVSIAGGFDFHGLRLRYAWESHHDYFGLGYIYAVLAGAPDTQIRTSNDWGNKALAQYTLTINEHVKTRIVGVGEHLKYTISARVPGDVNTYQRPAFYALLEQTAYGHHLWGAYGRAYPGTCTRVPQPNGAVSPCTTSHIGADYYMAGYMYSFAENAQAYVMAYRLVNQRSGLYVTSPPLPFESMSPGIDSTSIGLGFHYAFDAELL
jgi:predicted porin